MLSSKAIDVSSYNWRNILFEQSFKAVLPRGAAVSAQQAPAEMKRRNVYMHEIKPMLILLRVMGVLSYHTTPSGEIQKAPLLSVTAAYALLLRGTLATFTTFFLMTRLPLIGKPGAPFLYRLVDIGLSTLFSINYIISFTLWVEHNAVLHFFAEWKTFQTRYTEITRKEFRLRLRTKCLVSMIIVLFSTALLTTNSFFVGERSLWPPWQGAVLAYALVLGLLLPFFWYLTCNALNTSAKMLAYHLDQCIQQYEKLAELRQLWRSLSGLTRELGIALGLTYGSLSLIYLTELTLCVYATMYVVQIHLQSQAGIFLSAAAIFVAILYLQCDAADKATHQVGGNFQQQLEYVARTQLKRIAALEDEICIFLQSIQVIPPVINYSGFADVNRYLMSSLLAAVATYVVVLMQFEVSSE